MLGWFVVQYQRLVKAFSGLQKYTHTFENEMNDKGFLGQNDIGVRAAEARRSMKAWYSRHARALPWRENPSVYGTWLSEIMLQQTRVDTGIPKWHAFQEAFPDVAALAGASEEEVLKAWEGLGYYRRARLLHRAAQVIQHQQSGRFPSTYAGWLSLPGIGPYSAAAIASIAFGEAVAAVDGNVQRVASRWGGITEAVDSKAGAVAIQTIADAWLDRNDAGSHNQAVMELGALICKPQNPECNGCPLANTCCSANNPDMWSVMPVKKPKKKAEHWPLHWHVSTWASSVAVVQREAHGVWANMWVFPESAPPDHFNEVGLMGTPVKHLLTHKRIEASFYHWQAPDEQSLRNYAEATGGRLMSWAEFGRRPRPRLLTKIWDELLRQIGIEELP